MIKWATIIGITFIVIGVLLVSTLVDYLPVDLWSTLLGAIGSIFDNEIKHTYYKVVPGAGQTSYIYIYVLIAIGAILLALGRLYKTKAEKE